MSSAGSAKILIESGTQESENEEEFVDAPEHRDLQPDSEAGKVSDRPTGDKATFTVSETVGTQSGYKQFNTSKTPTVVVFTSKCSTTSEATLLPNRSALDRLGGSTEKAAELIVAWRNRYPDRSLNAFTDPASIQTLHEQQLFGCSWEHGDWARYDGFKAEMTSRTDDGWVEISIPDRSTSIKTETGRHAEDDRGQGGNCSDGAHAGLLSEKWLVGEDWVLVPRSWDQ